MHLAIDIGNTNIVIGGFEADNLEFVVRIATNSSKTEDEYAIKIKNALHIHGVIEKNITGAVISSVVPPLTSVIKNALKLIYGIDSLSVAPGIKTGINIRCDSPSGVGADLICACVAAHHLYGSPGLVIDMGTATKLLVMDKTGSFIGAVIAPGVRISLKALSGETAQLPQISLEAPPNVLGKNTVDCMRSGIVLGSAAMLDGMIDRINSEMGEELRVYATGGHAASIIRYCDHDITLNENLVLQGLNIIYGKNQG